MKKILLFLAISILLFNKVGYSQSPTNINVYLDDTIHFASNMHYYSVYYWDFGDGSTSTEEKPIYRFQNAGEYDVSVTAHDACCPDKDTTHYYHLTVYANQNALVDSNSISVTPNPFSDMLYVSYYIGNYNNYSSNLELIVIEVNTGLLRKQVEINPYYSNIGVDVSDLSTGFYSVSLLIDEVVAAQQSVLKN